MYYDFTSIPPDYSATETGRVRRSLVQRLQSFFYSKQQSPQQYYRRLIAETCQGKHRILDIGCGYAAPDLQGLVTNNNDVQKVGLDVVPDFATDKAPDVTFVCGDCERLPFDSGSFDLVISKSVLEHLSDPEPVFREVARVLRPSGRFVFLTPNRWDYVSVAATLIPNRFHARLVKGLTGRPVEDTFPTRYRANSIRRLLQLCRIAGLHVDVLSALRAHPHYLKFNAVAYLLGAFYEQTVQRFVPFARPWIIGMCSRQEQES